MEQKRCAPEVNRDGSPQCEFARTPAGQHTGDQMECSRSNPTTQRGSRGLHGIMSSSTTGASGSGTEHLTKRRPRSMCAGTRRSLRAEELPAVPKFAARGRHTKQGRGREAERKTGATTSGVSVRKRRVGRAQGRAGRGRPCARAWSLRRRRRSWRRRSGFLRDVRGGRG